MHVAVSGHHRAHFSSPADEADNAAATLRHPQGIGLLDVESRAQPNVGQQIAGKDDSLPTDADEREVDAFRGAKDRTSGNAIGLDAHRARPPVD